MKLRPYPEYKDSGVTWLGQVPAYWQLRRIKSLSPVLRGASPRPIDDPVYFDETGEYSWVRISDVTNSNKYLQKTTQRLSRLGKSRSVPLEPGSIFLSIAGSVGKPIITKISCCIHDGFVYFPKFDESVDYLYYLFLSGRLWEGLGKHGTQLNLNTDTVGSVRVGWPPFAEQTQIARYLDWKTAQIDRFIRAKRQLIERLKEQKQVLINQAVTGRIDVRTGKPYPEYKDSGVPWLGKVPAGWEVRPLKHAVRINTDVLPESTPSDFEFRYVEISDVGTGELVNEPETVTFGKAPSRARRRIEPGDTIVSTVRTYLKAVLHITEELKGTIVSTGFAVLRPKSGVHQEFLGYLLQADVFIHQVIAESVGVSYPAISETRLGGLKVAYPTDIGEQEQIVSFIEKKNIGLTSVITHTQREIDLIQEYRTRLIADVVTGKLDVRHVEVPEVDESEEVLDEGVTAGDAVMQDNLEAAM